jgi:hypothetical protein
VVTAIVSQVDTSPDLENFWSNYYLRGQMLYDPSANVGGTLYQQPYGGVPFSRGWIIGPDGLVVLPVFGYNPQLMIDTIDDLLAQMAEPGDVNGDGVIDVEDLLALLGAWGPCAPGEPCPADANGDGVVNVNDLLVVLGGWG